ncbi:MAG: hypothetical protein HWE39_14235 [Oceanospirillaceae bacterium]|nr:hypothetical protein [Oceanospirillaceae bacterium]
MQPASRPLPLIVFVLSILALGAALAAVVVPTDIQQPGTQPNEVSNLESPDKCDNCHGGYNSAVEPAHNWRGSMMAHAGRDPIFWATLAVAEKDFDGAGDFCLRCHSTGGWLAGRSTPTEGSGLTAGDSDGVECDFCHKLTNPDDSEHLGTMNDPFIANEPTDNDTFDWDDPAFTPSDANEGYLGSGMASMWGGSDKLGPYNNAAARHQFMESKFHRDRDFCGTCHDVSNPAAGDLAIGHGAQPTANPVSAAGVPGAPVDAKAAFHNPPYMYGIVERTFGEYKSGQIAKTLVSEYPSLPQDLQGGALEAIYKAATLDGTTDGNYHTPEAPRYFSCQSCHMRPVTGKGANKQGVPVRTDLPLHDLTGGNYWMPSAIEYLDSRGKLRLGGGMTQLQIDAMRDGSLRAREQLNLAASLTLTGDPGSVRVINHTGHKLISGYPEGRRMWLNIKWYDSVGGLLREDGKYDVIGRVNGIDVKSLTDLNDPNTKIYEAHMGMTQEWANQLIGLGYDPDLPLRYDRMSGQPGMTLGNLANSAAGSKQETFHFVLNNTVVKDNRIPPYGMAYDLARVRNALPVPADQYGGAPGGTYNYFDEVPLNVPTGAQSADISLMYQPTSWEYIQFLSLANDGSNAFLSQVGTDLLDAWANTGMAEPYVMASTSWGAAAPQCDVGTPLLLDVSPGDKQVTSSWQKGSATDPDPIGYKLYYDQAGKAQLVADLQCSQQNCTSYIDTGLTNGQKYCYKVTASGTSCESGFSNILCATPTQPGQNLVASVTNPLVTGKWVEEGKGKNATTSFVLTSDFAQGDGIVIQASIADQDGFPVAGATVAIRIDGPETAQLTTGPSDASGVAEVTWNTQAPSRKGQGGTAAGTYTATTTDVTSNDYSWDQTPASTTFSIGP